MAVLVGLAASVCAWARLDPVTRGTVWAEDGMFLSERLASGPLVTFTDPYAGYLHVLPRLAVDMVATTLPLPDAATGITAACCAIIGLVSALVYLCSHAVVSSPVPRVALGLLTVLVPPGPIEVMGNVANLHWYVLWLAPWLLLARPSTQAARVGLALVALLGTLSEVQSLLFLPLTIYALTCRARRAVALTFIIGACVQLVVSLTSPRPIPGGRPEVLDLLRGYVLNVLTPIWHPSLEGPGVGLADQGWAVAALAAVPLALVVGYLVIITVRRRVTLDLSARREDVAVVLAVAVGATVPFFAGLVLNFNEVWAYGNLELSELVGNRPLRYGVVPSMFVLAVVAIAVDRARLRRVSTAVTVVTLTALVAIPSFQLDATRRTAGPTWADGLAAAADECRHQVVEAVSVPVAPRGRAFQVTLDCDRLLLDSR